MSDTTTKRQTRSRSVAGLIEASRSNRLLARTFTAQVRPRSAEQARKDRAIALVYGAICHILFAAAVLSMIVGMWFGMTLAFGTVPGSWAWLANSALLLQFPLVHSLLLTRTGSKVLARLPSRRSGGTLTTTTFATIASVQLLALFVLWTPSGIVWWRAEGADIWIIGALYAASWLLLMRANWDAGAEVQSGLLGWMSLMRGVKPQYPPLPTTGLFAIVRQPIYVAFALTTWAVPIWTPDQLLVAVTLTLYCVLGPALKERRFARRFGGQWQEYRARTPYWIPRTKARRP